MNGREGVQNINYFATRAGIFEKKTAIYGTVSTGLKLIVKSNVIARIIASAREALQTFFKSIC